MHGVEVPRATTGPLAAAASTAVAVLLLLVRDALLLPELRVLCDVALAGALVLVARGRGLRLPSPTLLGVAALAWTGSHVMALDADASLETFAHHVRLLVAFALGATCLAGGSVKARALAVGVVACGAGLALHGWAQIAWLHPRLLLEMPAAAGQLADARANSVLLLPGHLAAVLAAAMALGVGLATASRGAPRIATSALVLVAASGLVAARSFSGLLLAGAGCGTVMLAALGPRARRWALVATVFAVVVLAMTSALLRQAELSRENPAVARARNWRSAASLVREAPLAGHGGGSFAVEHARVRPSASNDVRHAHQALLEAASDHGVVAMPLLVAGAAAVLLAGLRASRAAGTPGTLAAGFLGASVAALGHGMLDFGWSLESFGAPAAFLLGATWALPGRPSVSGRVAAGLGAAAILAALVTLADGLAQGCSERALLAAANADHRKARELLAAARRMDPMDDEWAAQGAAAALALAIESAPESSLLGEAERLARRAVALSPRKAARHELLARVLIARGRRVEAAAAALRASQLAPQRPELAALRDELLAGLSSGQPEGGP